MSRPSPRDHRLACQGDPERWFDAHHRAHALQHCLACPQRAWCARQALDGASYGMWAGVWIDDNLDDVAERLRAIATPGGGTHQPADAECGPTPIAEPPPPAWDTATSRLAQTGHTMRSVMAVILARSSGHCEVMTPSCRFTFDTAASRIPGHSAWEATDASTVYAVCRPCQEALAIADTRLIRRLGYLVDPPMQPAFTPLYWRRARWVYLEDGPVIVDTEPGAAAACRLAI